MTTFTHIVVDIDARAADHPALDRAVGIARATGAELTVVDVVMTHGDVSRDLPSSAEEELIESLRASLEVIAGTVTGITVHAKPLFGPPAAALVDEVERAGADLLVRSHTRDLVSVWVPPHGPINSELIRTCRAPVLLVGPGARPEHPHIVGAIAPEEGRPQVRALNRKIIDYTLLMAAVDEGSPRVLQAWTPFGEWGLRAHGSGDGGEIAAYVEHQREQTVAALVEVVDSSSEDPDKIALAAPRGSIGDVLPEYVVSHGVDLVVIGVPRRRGLMRLLFGHTAERVLRRLPCSILTVSQR